MYVCMYVACIYVYSVGIKACTYACLYVRTYVCAYLCMYVFTYILYV